MNATHEQLQRELDALNAEYDRLARLGLASDSERVLFNIMRTQDALEGN